MHRAVITGLGPLTPIGIGKDAFWSGLQSGKSAVTHISTFDASPFRSQIAGEVSGFDPADFLDSRKSRRMDRFAHFSVSSTLLAMQDADLNLEQEDRDRVGVCIGTALGGVGFAEKEYGVFRDSGLRAVDPSLALSVFCGSGSCNTAINIGATGPVTSNSNSCASGTIALGEALGFIRNGHADIVFAGGAEAPLMPLCFGAFDLIRAMSTRNDKPEQACRPFDRDRDGFVMAEGATVLVVEELEHALNRGARIYAELIGYGLTNDAYHMTAPYPDGSRAAQAMKAALADALVHSREIDYINAHGSSTPLNDKTETLAIKSVFGDRACRIPISSTKGHHAHALGATGAFEAAACALAIDRSYIPPTLNLNKLDIDCDLDYTPNLGRNHEIKTLISNSFGFGGINACVVMRRYEE